MFVTVLGRMATRMGIDVSSDGTTPFEDVTTDSWYSDYVAWAYERGIIIGESNTWLGAEGAVNRQEAATLLYRFLAYYDIDLPGTASADFTDAAEISWWASAAVAETVRTGLIIGHDDGRFGPREMTTRAQVAVIFLRFADAVA